MVPHVWKVAHRGASAERPENTLPAFELAIAQGADVIEADVRATGDGELLVLHDAAVDRTTDGQGPLREMTAATARRLDAGQGQRIPTVAEVLALARGKVRVNLDLKEVEVVEPAVSVVRELDMLRSVTFISFLPEAWEILDRLQPGTPVVYLFDSAAALASVAMGEVGTQGPMAGVGIPHPLANADLVDRLRRFGYGVFAWTVDEEDEMRRVIDAGVNGVVTNRPAVLGEVVRDMQAAATA